MKSVKLSERHLQSSFSTTQNSHRPGNLTREKLTQLADVSSSHPERSLLTADPQHVEAPCLSPA